MVDVKRWSICRPPSHNVSKRLYCKQAYIDLGHGIGIYDLEDFKLKFPELSQKYINVDQFQHWKQDAYARAVYEEPSRAYVLYASAGVKHDGCITLPAQLSKHCLAYRIYILVGSNAHLTVQHDQWGNAHNHITIHLEPGAQLTFMQTNKYAQEQYTYIASYQQTKSILNFHGWYTQPTYNHINLFLQEQYAQAEIKLGITSRHAMHSWFKTTQQHQSPDTKSNLLLKGLLHDTSRSTHIGMIYIDENAQRVEADLKSHYLLLSNQAQAYTIPSLEVRAHDVQCAHGSSIGSFDEEELFYMMSRGMDVSLAKELLATGFFNDINMLLNCF